MNDLAQRVPTMDDDDDFPEIEPIEEPDENGEEEPGKKGDRPTSVEERLLKNRTILIYGPIDMNVAMDVTKRLLVMDGESHDEIRIFINSPGGHVESGDTIYDMIRFVQSPVKIIGTGWVASAGALIYAAADLENRYSLPNTRFLLHQPAGGATGQASDIAIEAQEIIKMRRRLNEIFARQTGQSIEKVEEDTDRNFWMSAAQAKEYGLVGHIVDSADQI
ncbi:MAG: ATP-dependent Clp protease proteolytic subunit [Anaerolineae bacterium]|nr:ATP-dependent Clp protease proteolytic subunit [Promineifilum sp.]MCZ2113863.1 ATP-dependent Clp protease proteolytic subunit [Anaerolineae bacterium]HNS40370.1 ATP-dependent Clp protease proteolytic subunit [Promineifilum sp.]